MSFLQLGPFEKCHFVSPGTRTFLLWIDWLVDWLLDWMVDWLIECLIDCSIDWLIGVCSLSFTWLFFLGPIVIRTRMDCRQSLWWLGSTKPANPVPRIRPWRSSATTSGWRGRTPTTRRTCGPRPRRSCFWAWSHSTPWGLWDSIHPNGLSQTLGPSMQGMLPFFSVVLQKVRREISGIFCDNFFFWFLCFKIILLLCLRDY